MAAPQTQARKSKKERNKGSAHCPRSVTMPDTASLEVGWSERQKRQNNEQTRSPRSVTMPYTALEVRTVPQTQNCEKQ